MPSQATLTEYLKKQTFVAFDTETTGLWAPTNHVVEIGAVKFSLEAGEQGRFQQLVNPGRPIPDEVIRIHGITDDAVRNAPTVKPILESFLDFCGENSILVAHNAPFDISFLGCEMGRSGLDFAGNPILDSVDIYRRVFPELESYSLESLAVQFQIASSQKHRALQDAHLVYRLFVNAAARFPPIDSLDDLVKQFVTYSLKDGPASAATLPPEYSELQKAVDQNHAVEIHYRGPNQPVSCRIIHVKNVYQLGARYYLHAFCEQVQAERTFRLDRVEKYQILAD